MKQIKLYKNIRKLILRLVLASSIFLVLFFWVDKGAWHWIGMIGVLLGSAFIFILSFGKPIITISERGIKYYMSEEDVIEWKKIQDVVITTNENQIYLRLMLESLAEIDISLEEVRVNKDHLRNLILNMIEAENTFERRKLIDKFWKKREAHE